MVETNRSTLHTVYNIQQSTTQGSNDTTQRLPRRTAATTRCGWVLGVAYRRDMNGVCTQETV